MFFLGLLLFKRASTACSVQMHFEGSFGFSPRIQPPTHTTVLAKLILMKAPATGSTNGISKAGACKIATTYLTEAFYKKRSLILFPWCGGNADGTLAHS